ncbi:MAG: LemA family protein [Desulfatiglandaceae bacterium]
MMIITAIVAAVAVLVVILLFNSLVRKKNQVITASSTIDVLVKKRFDLIPNLIKAVQRYMQHEAGVLTDITAMRAKAVSGEMSDAETADLDRKATQVIGRIMVAAENYPDLKASRNFADLQASLNEVEEQISAARRAYNASVRDYNNALEMFPSNIVAALMRYRKKVFFEIAEQERANVDVGSLFDS